MNDRAASKAPSLNQLLATVGLIALVACLVCDFWSIGFQLESRKDFMELTRLLLSGKAIVGTLAWAGGVAFKRQIRHWLAPDLKDS